MDDGAFDALSRGFGGRAGSRRATVGGLAGLAGVALAARRGAPAAEARQRKKKKCKACQVRQGKKCVKAADDSVCKTDGRCLDGKCNPPPDCLSSGEICSASTQCCSVFCQIPGGFSGFCAPASAGARCRLDADCFSNNCVGFVCQ